MPLSPETKETIPLLEKKETVVHYTKEIQEDIIEPTPIHDSDSASTSNTVTRDEAGPFSAGGEDTTTKKEQAMEEEMAESISSYEGMAGVFSPTYGCGPLFGIWLYLCHILSSFVIQFPLHLLLLSLPIATGFMGAKYMTQCPMDVELPYTVMVVGGLGTLVLLVRLTYLLHAKYSTDDLLKKWLKTGTKLLEFVFLASLITELCFSYKNSPSFVPGDVNYCNQTFYKFVCSMNNVWITLAVVWGFLYFITGQRCMRRSAP